MNPKLRVQTLALLCACGGDADDSRSIVELSDALAAEQKRQIEIECGACEGALATDPDYRGQETDCWLDPQSDGGAAEYRACFADVPESRRQDIALFLECRTRALAVANDCLADSCDWGGCSPESEELPEKCRLDPDEVERLLDVVDDQCESTDHD